jgi:hypothetical protein
MIKTINQIKKDFEDYSNIHEQLKTFGYGQEFEQIGKENIIYPLMWVVPVSANLNDTTLSRVFRVIIADRVRKGEQNELEVESDTQLICLDTLAYWTRMGENQGFEVGTSVSLTPFWEKWTDEVTGHFIDISIDEFYDYNSCSIPIDGSIPSGATCKPARITINDLFFGNAPSDELFNIIVKNEDGLEVGQIVDGEWIVPNGGGGVTLNLSINSDFFKTLSANYNLGIVNSNDDEIGTLDEPNNKVNIADSTISIKDENDVELYEINIEAEGIVSQTIDNSTIDINKSDGSLITQRSILAEGTDSYNVADSSAVLKDEDGNILSTTPIKATESEDIVAPNGDVTVNSVPFDDVLSGGTLDIEVLKSTGNDQIGSKQGQYWRIGDSTAVIKDSANNTLKSEDIMATESEDITINDSTLNVQKSDGTLISARSILAEGTTSYNVADSTAVIKDSAGTTLKSEDILAATSENITINDSTAVIKDSAGTTIKSEDILAEASENITINDSVAVLKDSAAVTLDTVNLLAEETKNITLDDFNVEVEDPLGSVILTDSYLAYSENTLNLTALASTMVVMGTGITLTISATAPLTPSENDIWLQPI